MLYLIVIGHVYLWCGIIFDIVTTWSCTLSWGHSCDCSQIQNHLQITNHLISHQTARICGSYLSQCSPPHLKTKGSQKLCILLPSVSICTIQYPSYTSKHLIRAMLNSRSYGKLSGLYNHTFCFLCTPMNLTFCHGFKDGRLVNRFFSINSQVHYLRKGLHQMPRGLNSATSAKCQYNTIHRHKCQKYLQVGTQHCTL